MASTTFIHRLRYRTTLIYCDTERRRCLLKRILISCFIGLGIAPSACHLHVNHNEDYQSPRYLNTGEKGLANYCRDLRRLGATYYELQAFAHAMDKVSREIEEWGTLGMSSPIIAHNKKQFKFDPGVTAKDLYAQNRTEGAVALRTSRAVNAGIEVDTKKLIDNILGNQALLQQSSNPAEQSKLQGLMVDAMRTMAGSPEGQAALTGLLAGRPEFVGIVNSVLGIASAETPDGTDADSTSGASAETGSTGASDSGDESEGMSSSAVESLAEASPASKNAAAEAVGKLSEGLATFDSTKLAGINPRRRIRLTASDFWELNLHKFFSVPENLVGDFKPIFVTFSVSCQPGWRTREGFAGIIDSRVEYMYVNNKGASIPLSAYLRRGTYSHLSNESILPVAGIYPAYDSQELNLRNSQRDLRTFAAQLAANGELAAAKVFLESASKTEQDAETNTGIATVTGFSNGGHGFGYEFRPTFRALKQPGSTKTKSGFRLEPISFPAVAIALVDMGKLKKLFRPIVIDEIISKWAKRVTEDLEITSADFKKAARPAKDTSDTAKNARLADLACQVRQMVARAVREKIKEAIKSDFYDPKATELKVTISRNRIKEIIEEVIDPGPDEIAQELIRAEPRKNRKCAGDDIKEELQTIRKGLEKAVESCPKLKAVLVETPLRDFKNDIKSEVKKKVDSCQLAFSVNHSWRPIKPPFAYRIPVVELLGRLFQPRFSEFDFIERLRMLGAAYEHFDKTFCNEYDYDKGPLTSLGNRYACERIRSRWAMLAVHAVNFESGYAIALGDFKEEPPSKLLTITSTSPKIGWLDNKTIVVVQGKNFGKWQMDGKGQFKKDTNGDRAVTGLVKKVTIGGHLLNMKTNSQAIMKYEVLSPTTLVAIVKKDTFGRSGIKHDITVVTQEGSATIRNAIEFKKKTVQQTTVSPKITITRDGDGRVTEITIHAAAINEKKDGDLLDAIKAILKNEECCDDVQIEVKCTATKK